MIMPYDYKLLSTYRTQLMGFATLWIVFYHSTVNLNFVPALMYVKNIGYCGVDIFLILSGLGLYFAYQKKSSLYNFYRGRLIRIIPTFLPVAVVSNLFLWLSGSIPISWAIINATTLGFWLNTGMLDWYISAILFLYFLTPLVLHTFNRKFKYTMVLAVILGAVLSSLLLTSIGISHLLILTTRIPVFIVGILIGYWIDINKKVTGIHFLAHILMLASGLTMLLISFKYFSSHLWDYGLFWYPFILMTLPLCMAGAVMLQKISGTGNRKLVFLTFCGTHSFEIYLFHVRVLPILKPVLIMPFDRYGIVFNLICFMISLVMALIWRKIVTFQYTNNADQQFKGVETR